MVIDERLLQPLLDCCKDPKITKGFDSSLPGLYEFHIDGVGSYIAQCKTNISRRHEMYVRNVKNLLDGKPYRQNNPDGYRRIHRELARALRTGKTIRFILLENCPLADIYRRERELIARRGTLNGHAGGGGNG